MSRPAPAVTPVTPNFLLDPTSKWAVLSATVERLGAWDCPANLANDRTLRHYLDKVVSVPYLTGRGRYKGVDQGPSYLILADEAVALYLGLGFQQESILSRRGLVWCSGAQVIRSKGFLWGDEAKACEFYTELDNGLAFSVELDVEGEA